MSDFDDASESRKRPPAPSPTNSIKSSASASKRSKSTTKSSPSSTAGDKSSRGLRHFSMMVCQKVEEKGTTTYNEVADELVKKVVSERETEGKFDEKNIRRRVYDALNVLMAMDIISKEKKDITWRGLPNFGGQDVETMRDELEYRQAQLQQKKDALKELMVQQVCFRNLIWHNHQRSSEEKIPLPFIVVNTHASAVIQCDMSRDRTDVMFDFSMPFEINDDNTILKKMGLDKTSMPVLQEMLPSDLLQYCENHRLLDPVLGSERPHSRQHPGQHHSHHPSQQPGHHHGQQQGATPPQHHHRTPEHQPSSMQYQHQYHHQPPPPYHQHPRGGGYPPPHYGGYDPMAAIRRCA